MQDKGPVSETHRCLHNPQLYVSLCSGDHVSKISFATSTQATSVIHMLQLKAAGSVIMSLAVTVSIFVQ